MNISENTQFYGVGLGKKQKEFAHNCNTNKYSETKTNWQNIDKQHWSDSFIVRFEDGSECAGTAIVENGWALAVYISAIGEANEFTL